jgi:RimJ/RimL family protein N-acetyltransferase
VASKYKKIFAEIAGGQPLKTGRLEIRRWTRDEAGTMAEFYNADGRAYPLYIGWDDGDYNAGYMRDILLDHLDKIAPGELAIFRGDKIVGMLVPWQDHARRPRLSYYILPFEREHGYGFEAYMAGLREIARRGGPKTMVAEVKPDNFASQKLLLKAAFHEAGRIISKSGVLKGSEVVLFRRDMSDLKPH